MNGKELASANVGPMDRIGRAGLWIAIGLAALKLALHMLTASNYGLFIDELYFFACGEHLAWGYVDMPPLTALQAWAARALFQGSLFGIRLFPALAGAGMVLLTGAAARELGGRRFAQALACVGAVIAPVYLLVGSYLSMNSIEPLIWTGCAFLLIRIVRTGDVRLWLVFGLLAGVGLLNKETMAIFGFALLSGLLLTRARKVMLNRWFLMGGALALAIFAPALAWMIRHGFPHFEQLANVRLAHRNVDLDPLEFLVQQVTYQHPLAAPIWLGGLVYFFARPAGKTYRFLGWAYAISLAVLLAADGRPYYLSPAYPILLAGGSVWIEGALGADKWRWAKPCILALLGIGGAILAPFTLPLLPPESYIRYSKSLGIDQAPIETHELGVLPQLFADRFGWPEMAAAVADVFRSLPPEERSRAIILARNYGQAGAIDFYGPALGLPKAMSGHLTYYYWGERTADGVMPGATAIVLAISPEALRPYFQSVEIAGHTRHPYSMPYENFPIYLCRGLKVPLSKLWPSFKNWN
jgi:hypothetical protein